MCRGWCFISREMKLMNEPIVITHAIVRNCATQGQKVIREAEGRLKVARTVVMAEAARPNLSQETPSMHVRAPSGFTA